MSSTLVSIIISAWNAEQYLGQTLESLLNQTWPNLEIIVVNDGSTDNTLQVAKSFAARGVKAISQNNKGQDAALNLGYKHSNGDYIKFMDSDDLLNPEMIETQMQTLNGSQEHIAYGEWARFYNNKPELADFTPLDYWRDGEPVDFLTARPEGVMLQCGIMLIPRPIIEKAGLWDERLILFNDTEFFTRAFLCSKGIKFSKGARLYYRSAISSSITAGRTRRFYESTFLATGLIAKQMLAVEDSPRVRNLIANTYLIQYYKMYPEFPDLVTAHEKQLALYGPGTLQPDGGKVFKLLNAIAGWKTARRIQSFFYKAGYKPVHPGLKILESNH
jgi:glycosyltransferase involved in cell wall biosynthesis